jgi:hypothetical protein
MNYHFTTAITVPSGAVCDLYNTTVDGAITVRPGAALLVNSGTASAQPSLIKGGINASSAYLNITNSTVLGPIVNYAPADSSLVGAGIGAGQLCGNTLQSVTITRMPKYEGYSVGGGSCSQVECLCASPSYVGEGGNSLSGALSVSYNQSLVSIEDNSIAGPVTCSYNTPPPDYSDNYVKGAQVDQCKPA